MGLIAPWRHVALVVVFVVLVIGVGAVAVGGTGTLPVPNGWVTVHDGRAQLDVPANWNVFYNRLCRSPLPPGSLFVITVNPQTVPICGKAIWRPNVPYVTMFPYTDPAPIGARSTVNTIPVWTDSSPGPGFLLIEAPSLGVSLTGTGPAAANVIETLFYSSDD